MRYFSLLLILFVLSANITSCSPDVGDAVTHAVEESRGNILIFSKTGGFRHEAIEPGREALTEWANRRGYTTTVTEDADYFTAGNLARHEVVVFMNTSETIFEDDHREAFQEYIRNGGGYVGVHAASDTEYDWPWYGELVGAYFANHPPGVFEAEVRLVDPDHISTYMLPERWVRIDEWYNFREIPQHVNVLLEMDTGSYEGSDHPGNHPISWYHEYDGGRAFYTGFGHSIESFSERLFMKHLWGGIQYAMGKDL